MSKANVQRGAAVVLGEAILSAGAKLGLTPDDVGRVVGSSCATIAQNGVDPASVSGQLALMLIRIYHGIYPLVGGRDDEMRHWMHTRIRTLNGVPAEMINDVSGLVHVAEYVDALRSRP